MSAEPQTSATGSKLQLNVADVEQAEGHFIVLNAGTLTGGATSRPTTDFLPFLYKGALTVTGNQVAVDISRKSATELGLNRSESAAYGAIYEAIGTTMTIGDSFLGIRNQEDFVDSLRQMLPDHAGGTFEAVTMGDRTLARMLSDPKAPYKEEGGMTLLCRPSRWGSSKSIGDTAGYEIGGWGVTGGAELTPSSAGSAGRSAICGARMRTVRPTIRSLPTNIRSPLTGGCRTEVCRSERAGSYSYLDFDGTALLPVRRRGRADRSQIEGEWNGSLFSAAADASQELWAGSFFIRPSAGIEYYRLERGWL